MEHLQFPIGRYVKPDVFTKSYFETSIADIESLPARLEATLTGWSDEQLDTPYRPGGWTVRQLVHHLADSHINAFVRIHLALTEDNPTIKPYEQDDWVKLPDARMPIGVSLDVLRGLHARWAFLLKSLSEEQWKRTFFHPESQKIFAVEEMAGVYAHHGNNHLAQIEGLKAREGWA
ncbi:MAG: YfiT family bacillithiol transferase [Bacteroidota bacterium]